MRGEITIVPTRQLAIDLCRESKTPKILLKASFLKVMQILALQSKDPIPPSTTKKVWKAVKKNRLSTLQEQLISEISKKVLSAYTTKEIEVLLKWHPGTNDLLIDIDYFCMQEVLKKESKSIAESLLAKKDDLIQEVSLHLMKEKVKFTPSSRL